MKNTHFDARVHTFTMVGRSHARVEHATAFTLPFSTKSSSPRLESHQWTAEFTTNEDGKRRFLNKEIFTPMNIWRIFANIHESKGPLE
jgi:hypothetical protein